MSDYIPACILADLLSEDGPVWETHRECFDATKTAGNPLASFPPPAPDGEPHHPDRLRRKTPGT